MSSIVKLICDKCGTEFSRGKAENARRNRKNCFCSRKCWFDSLSRSEVPYFSEGRWCTTRNGKAVRMAVVVAEKALGRPLPKGCQVHHVNGDSSDDRNSNLVICPSASYHQFIHYRGKALREGYDNRISKRCQICREILAFSEFSPSSRNGKKTLSNKCKKCCALYQRMRRENKKGEAK